MAGANMMGWAMLLVVVMALYVGKAQAGLCIVDCSQERAAERGGSAWSYAVECFNACSDNSFVQVPAKPSPQLEKALELLAQAPELQQDDVKLPSLGRKAFPPSHQTLIVEDFHH
ncbi:hypothetical protein MKX01_009221 [Papaver californicum]|nr:hypothetical protein MKX01_009221 [Papaver californicum]